MLQKEDSKILPPVLKSRPPRNQLALSIKTEEGEGLGEKLINYSQEGCRFTSPIIFHEGEFVTLALYSTKKSRENGKGEYRLGKIVWSKSSPSGQNEYGMKFH